MANFGGIARGLGCERGWPMVVFGQNDHVSATSFGFVEGDVGGFEEVGGSRAGAWEDGAS